MVLLKNESNVRQLTINDQKKELFQFREFKGSLNTAQGHRERKRHEPKVR